MFKHIDCHFAAVLPALMMSAYVPLVLGDQQCYQDLANMDVFRHTTTDTVPCLQHLDCNHRELECLWCHQYILPCLML